MWFSSCLRGSLRTPTVASNRPSRRCSKSQPRRARPALETLEDRCLLSAGQLDPTFGVGGKVITDIQVPSNSPAQSLVINQVNGKILVLGTSSAPRANPELAAARYNADGSLDNTFGRGGVALLGQFPNLAAAAVDSHGRIVVAGNLQASNYYAIVGRFNTDGTADTGFGYGGRTGIQFTAFFDVATALAIDAQDRVVVAGQAQVPANNYRSVMGVVRLNSDGTLDNSFDGDGRQTIDFSGVSGAYSTANAVAIDAQGCILLAGSTSQGSGGQVAVVRLTSTGALDSTFDGDGKQTIDFGPYADRANGVALDSQGRIVVAGYSYTGYAYSASSPSVFAVARLTSAGVLDSNFNGNGTQTFGFGRAVEQAKAVAIDAQDRVVVAGDSYSFSGVSSFAVARLTSTGALDATFNGTGKRTIDVAGTYNQATGVGVLNTQGRIVIGGSTLRGNSFDFALARLTDGGMLDAGFNGTGLVTTAILRSGFDTANSVTLTQPDGKIVVIGTSTGPGTYSDSSYLSVARYNTDGTPDASFGNNGQVVGGPVLFSAATLDAQGRIVVVGTAQSAYYIYRATMVVVRFNADGTPDTSFNTPSFNFGTTFFGQYPSLDFARAVTVDAQGRVIVAGTTNADGAGHTTVTRYTTTGALDTTFNGTGKLRTDAGDGSAVTTDAQGRILLIGGSVARLTSTGALDTSFNGTGTQTVPFGSASAVALDAQGRIVLGGTSANSHFAAARLNADGTLDAGFGDGGQTVVNFSGDAYGAEDRVQSVAIDPAGYIVLAGSTYSYDHGSAFAVAMLKPDGLPDVDFGVGGKVTSFFPTPVPYTAVYNLLSGVAIDPAGRIVVAGTTRGYSGGDYTFSDFVVARYLGHDPVVEASPTTFVANLQAAVTALDTGTPVGTPRVVVHVTDPARLPAVLSAVASLTVNPAGPAIEILLDLPPGTYTPGLVTVPAGLRLLFDGGVSGVRTFVGSSGPALTLVSGDVVIRNGATFDSTGNAATIRVLAGQLTVQDSTLRKSGGNAATLLVEGGRVSVRGSTIEETPGGNQAAVSISGGLVDLGTTWDDPYTNGSSNDPGGNTIAVHGPGLLIRNTGPNDVPAFGDTFLQDGAAFADDYRIEDAIHHALDVPGDGMESADDRHGDHATDGHRVGTVFWIPNNVFVSATNGRVQRGVDLVPAGGTVNVETGVHGDFSAGTKLLTVAFQDGSSMTQQVDDLDPTRRSLVVMGTYGNDTIRFEPGDDRGVRVKMNNVPRGTFLPTGRLIAYGQDGSDHIEVSNDIHLSAWLYGGYSGNNYLKGGGGNDVLVGGIGNDTLIGGGGRDLLIGEGGNDLLDGRGGDDILIGGATVYDYDEFGLTAIMAEWTSAHDYATRVNNLVYGGGLNGDGYENYYTLTQGATVYDAGGASVLNGGAGRDLFFASLTDTITGLRANETVFAL